MRVGGELVDDEGVYLFKEGMVQVMASVERLITASAVSDPTDIPMHAVCNGNAKTFRSSSPGEGFWAILNKLYPASLGHLLAHKTLIFRVNKLNQDAMTRWQGHLPPSSYNEGLLRSTAFAVSQAGLGPVPETLKAAQTTSKLPNSGEKFGTEAIAWYHMNGLHACETFDEFDEKMHQVTAQTPAPGASVDSMKQAHAMQELAELYADVYPCTCTGTHLQPGNKAASTSGETCSIMACLHHGLMSVWRGKAEEDKTILALNELVQCINKSQSLKKESEATLQVPQ